MSENVDRHVLAGFVCVDAITSGSISGQLTVTTPQLVLRRNRSGVFAVLDVKGMPALTALTDQFVAPTAPGTWPLPLNYEVTIQDPTLRYLSRRANIAAPQPLPASLLLSTTAATSGPLVTTTGSPTATTTPAPVTTPGAASQAIPPVTIPQSVVLYPTPAAWLAPNWAVVRVAVMSNATPPAALPWVVIQVTSSGNTTATGLTNENGEALVAVPGMGLKLSSSSTGSVTETMSAATVTAWFDPSTLGQAKGWVSNPDDILLKLGTPDPTWKTASKSIQLGPGQTVPVSLMISI